MPPHCLSTQIEARATLLMNEVEGGCDTRSRKTTLERARNDLGSKLVHFTLTSRGSKKHYWGLADRPLPSGASIIQGRRGDEVEGAIDERFTFKLTTFYLLSPPNALFLPLDATRPYCSDATALPTTLASSTNAPGLVLTRYLLKKLESNVLSM